MIGTPLILTGYLLGVFVVFAALMISDPDINWDDNFNIGEDGFSWAMIASMWPVAIPIGLVILPFWLITKLIQIFKNTERKVSRAKKILRDLGEDV
jgi:hypothetical protein